MGAVIAETARPLKVAQPSHYIKAEILVCVPLMIWSIPNETTLAPNAPIIQQCSISNSI